MLIRPIIEKPGKYDLASEYCTFETAAGDVLRLSDKDCLEIIQTLTDALGLGDDLYFKFVDAVESNRDSRMALADSIDQEFAARRDLVESFEQVAV